MDTRVIIMAGGTGGHVFPALAVAQELRTRGCELSWMGTAVGLEARLVPAAGLPLDALTVSGVRGKTWLDKLKAPWMLVNACAEALRILRTRRPNLVLGMGGFASGPGGLMARLLGIPLVIHEQNCIPGTTNRWLARWAAVVLEAFPGSFPAPRKAICTGNPVREELLVLSRRRRPPGATGALRLLVFGGSQGAQALNETVPEALARLKAPIAVWHQTGTAGLADTTERYRRLGVNARIAGFIDDMAEAYAWADLALCRAGAMTVSELMTVGLPALLVPYPHAIDDHQTRNAQFLAEAGAALCLPQSAMSAERLADELAGLLNAPAKLASMAERALALAKPGAARRVAELCLREARP